MSCSDADTKKYSWRRRNSRPASVLSLGYRIFEIASARDCCARAPTWSPSLNTSRRNGSPARADHSRSGLTWRARQPCQPAAAVVETVTKGRRRQQVWVPEETIEAVAYDT